MHALSETAARLLTQPCSQPWSAGGHWGDKTQEHDRAAAMSALGAGVGGAAACSIISSGGVVSSCDDDALSGVGEAVVTAVDFSAAMRRVGPSIVRGAEMEVQPVRETGGG